MVLNFYKYFITEVLIDRSSGMRFLQTAGIYIFPEFPGATLNMLPNHIIRPG